MAPCIVGFLIIPICGYTQEDYLAPEVAFQFSAKMTDVRTVEVRYLIADGYYMYRDRYRLHVDKINPNIRLGTPTFPPGHMKFDEAFQKQVEIYRDSIVFHLPVEAHEKFTLHVTGQGCADKGLCYAPMESTVQLSVSDAVPNIANEPVLSDKTNNTEMNRIEATLKKGSLLTIFSIFFLLGLGLSFTPCVLPMIPILSFILVGEGMRVSRARGLLLSVAYVLGVALIYTALGIAAGLAGEGLAAELQNPWVLGFFAAFMVGLALSMLGVYQLQIPVFIQVYLSRFSQKQSRGKLLGVFMMGALSALIVGPCVAAPLAGVLLYISQTRDATIGGIALFSMAIGMSVPLLLTGASASTLLPRVGAWMEAVKRFFGILMLAMALWIVAPVIPVWAHLMGWSMLSGGYGVYLLRHITGWGTRFFGALFLLFGLIQFTNGLTGGKDIWMPWNRFSDTKIKKIPFARIKNELELDRALMQARGKIVMLDFYADWCVACKEMEQWTFSNPRVQTQLKNMVLLQVDVTANDVMDKALLKRFHLFGPPGIIFFDKAGHEMTNIRIIGYQDATQFVHSLNEIGKI